MDSAAFTRALAESEAGKELAFPIDEYEGRAKICKLDVDAAQKTAGEYGIRSIPTLLIFKDGKLADQIVGAAH